MTQAPAMSFGSVWPRPGSAPSKAEVFVSSDVDLLEDMNRQAGWRCEYRQLESGSLQTASAVREIDGLLLLQERSDRRLELAAEPPADMVTVVAAVGRDLLTMNGARMRTTDFAILTPGAELIGVTHRAGEATTLQIPASTFADQMHYLDPDLPPLAPGRARVVREPAADRGRLGALLEEVFRFDAGGPAASELASALVTAVIVGLHDEDRPSDSGSEVRRREILRVAREYIEAHLARPIRMADVCKAAETSLSTLERAFRRELRLTPLQYVRARRLNAVRKVLKSPAARNRSIARIATGYGFGHLGRFSHDYHGHFGELPSESRRASRISGSGSPSSGLAS